MRPRRFQFITILFLVVLFTGCFETDRVNGGSMYNWYSIEEDVGIGTEVIGSALKEGKEKAADSVDQPDFTRYIQGIVDRIARVSHYPEFPWEMHTMNVGIVNAWCAPGGKIMVYGGLFTQAGGFVDIEDENEVAAVLGHEIAHATCRHVTNAMSWKKTVFLSIFPVYIVAVIAIPELTEVWDLTLQGGFAVWAASYSRSHEAEADRVGAEYAARAGFDPRGAVRIWQRAHQLYGSESDLLGSHPPNEERAQLLEEQMPKLVEIYESVKGGSEPKPYTWE